MDASPLTPQRAWLGHALAIPLALVAVVLLEVPRVPAAAYLHAPARLLSVAALGLEGAIITLRWPLVYAVAVAVVVAAYGGAARRVPRARLALWVVYATVIACGAGAVVHLAYEHLRYNHAFRRLSYVRPLYGVMFAALAVASVTASPAAASPDGEARARVRVLGALARWGVAVAALVGAAAMYVANHTLEPHFYMGFHWSAWLLTFLFLQVGIAHVLVRSGGRWLTARAVLRVWLAVLIAALVAAAVNRGLSTDQGSALFHRHTIVGEVMAEIGPKTHVTSRPIDAARAHPADDAVTRFADGHHLPDLEDRALGDSNVLIIMMESTRYDDTTLADPTLDTTPALARLVERGAFSYTRAYSPGAGTLQSLSAMLSMGLPSSAHILSKRKDWRGVYQKRNLSAGELARDAGFDTFMVGHSGLFNHFGQGFRRFRRIVRRRLTKYEHRIDGAVRKAALAELRRRKGAEDPFFGWVGFYSPHEPYVNHSKKERARNTTQRLRYRGEVRHMDRQIGRVLDELDESGRLDDTIVVITADHGEEFGEHGRTGHAAHVYEQQIHVPLVIWVPWLTGDVIDAPTSTTYVFPWLLLQADARTQERTAAVLQAVIGPLLRETEGAVVAEIIGRRNGQVALIYEDYKLIHDFKSDAIEIYDLNADPGERHNLYDARPELRARLVHALDGYRAVQQRNWNALFPEPEPEPEPET